MKGIQIEKYFCEKDIVNDYILDSCVQVKCMKLEINVNNRESQCIANEIFTLEIFVNVHENKGEASLVKKPFYSLRALNRGEGNYLILGQTQIAT